MNINLIKLNRLKSLKKNNALCYNINQLRNDLWNYLKQQLTELIRDNDNNGKAHKENVFKTIEKLKSIESYYAFPSKSRVSDFENALNNGEYQAVLNKISKILLLMVNDGYRRIPHKIIEDSSIESLNDEELLRNNYLKDRKYFEVLIVDDLSSQEKTALKQDLRRLREHGDKFIYEINVQPSFQDVLIALLFNFNIQAVVIRNSPFYKSSKITPDIEPFIQNVLKLDYSKEHKLELGPLLAKGISIFRPDIDLYYITDTGLSNLKDSTLNNFKRIFYGKEDLQELHLTIIKNIQQRYNTPFFSALKDYSQKPTGVFHAMPISRGNSVFKSHWISDFGDFYGRNVFLAETSATTGGLDSLLQPTGPLKKAQQMAAKAYGSDHTFFVTNGTSTANKIVQQALIQPGDVVLIDRDCHKSHHYSLVLSGGFPVYLDSYPIEEYSMYGAVPLTVIKEKLLELKSKNRLDKVKMLVLTNCTFDGLVYNVERVMQEILALKPDMIFLWDEAWFAFAGFSYVYKQRTGMFNARKLQKRYKSKAYRKQYEEHIQSLKEDDIPLLPNPDEVVIRVYSTQSTHKTLSSFRQGSMIHVWDEEFRRKVSDNFHEAYMTHTSTSPNYQLLASLDAGRRQVQFEGYEMVEKSIEMSMAFRAKINQHDKLKKYFRILTSKDLIPEQHRESGIEKYFLKDRGWTRLDDSWSQDEFVLDPTKITLSIGATGVDGDTFKNEYLMDKFNIQINKTSRNTILLMTNIGTTSSSVVYLTNALLQIAEELDERIKAFRGRELQIHEKKIKSLMEDLPPLPDFSRFHSSFQAIPGVPGGNIREAYFLAYQEENCTYIPLGECLNMLNDGEELISTSFIIPYPPGFPVLVPGQVISREIIEFMLALDVSEIHGYQEDLGVKVFNDNVLNRKQKSSSTKTHKTNA